MKQNTKHTTNKNNSIQVIKIKHKTKQPNTKNIKKQNKQHKKSKTKQPTQIITIKQNNQTQIKINKKANKK